MKVGFTGTQKGTSSDQFESLISVLLALRPTEFHHGDCVGADDEAAAFVKKYIPKCKIFSHPPHVADKRAHSPSHVILMEKEYLQRDRDIVDASQILVATPFSDKNVQRSGTWYTIRYARTRTKGIYLVERKGKIVTENVETETLVNGT